MSWPKGKPADNAKLLENDFIRIFEEKGSAGLEAMGLDRRRVFERRATIEKKIGRALIETWSLERQLQQKRAAALTGIAELGVESEESVQRWRASKAPQ